MLLKEQLNSICFVIQSLFEFLLRLGVVWKDKYKGDCTCENFLSQSKQEQARYARLIYRSAVIFQNPHFTCISLSSLGNQRRLWVLGLDWLIYCCLVVECVFCFGFFGVLFVLFVLSP